MAREKLRAMIFPEEAKNVSQNIKKRLGEIALQHRMGIRTSNIVLVVHVMIFVADTVKATRSTHGEH